MSDKLQFVEPDAGAPSPAETMFGAEKMNTEVQLMTADELLVLPRGQFRYELIDGELTKMSPAGQKHGRVTLRLTVPLAKHVQDNQLGEVYAAETGFKLKSNPDTVLAADIAFVRKERLEVLGETESYWPAAPDLAVEVNSPSDTVREVEKKVMEWLEFGTRLVWVISSKLHTITVYRSLTEIAVLTENDTLDGGDVVPGFQISIAEIFA
jgi:Uma2 family endonuclease